MQISKRNTVTDFIEKRHITQKEQQQFDCVSYVYNNGSYIHWNNIIKDLRKNNCHARILFPAKYFSRMRVKERLFFF